MLVSKLVQIEFASPTIRAVDAIQDIRRAAESASLNLFSRYDVRLEMPMVFNENHVVVEIKVPEEIAGTFAIGNHLRGISTFLLNMCKGRYDQYICGNRLLSYIEVPNLEKKSDSLSMVDRLGAISQFAKLLERNDSEAIEQINRILIIIKEANRL